MRVLSWNVNGIRACSKKGLGAFLSRSRASIVGLQEVRAFPEQVPEEIRKSRWHQHYAPAERPGYSGVALLSRYEPEPVQLGLAPRFQREGRAVAARYGRLVVCSAYFPKGDGPNRDLSRIPYKLAFYRALLKELSRHFDEPMLVMGDFNTAREDIDLARPRENVKNSGFRPEERRTLEQWFRAGWVDTFRAHCPEGGHYTWWSQRPGVREKNVGWRIDYVLANPAAMRFVTNAFTLPHVRGSDHCPVGVDLSSKLDLRTPRRR
ncbi:MAG: exodeoxyribonuclease III [Myxococcales bacterium]|nr:exodeoxyribonuclease III [Myxococcales bacterium]MCB9581661.1 exodeoxyribonuclease III [Polyangiaceae bacterium]